MEATIGIERVLERLGELEKGEGQLSCFAKDYRELLRIQAEATSRATVVRPNLSAHLVQQRLREGIPLLPFGDFRPDWNQVQAVLKRILAWATAEEVSRPMHDDLRTISVSPGFLKEAAEAWYRGLSLKSLAGALGIDEELLTSVVGAALKPFLLAYSSLLLPDVDQESWRRNVCPVCGGRPDFSVLKEGGARWLFCSRCDAEWLFSRIECPYCGTRNQESLGYLTSEEQPDVYRIYLCEECRTYLKALDARVSETEVLLPLERVMTLHLDGKGRAKGYRPGWMTPKDSSCFCREPAGKEVKERRVH